MSEHLTEQQLIDYAYKLASDPAMQEARAHLDACDQCRRTLEGLRARLGVLELLRDDIQASDELVARVVEDAAKPRKVAIFPYRYVISITATAAVFLLGVTWLLLHTFGAGRQPEEAAVRRSRQPEKRLAMTLEAPDKGATSPSRPVGPQRLDEEVLAAVPATPSLALAPAGEPADEIVETPPFAPASAIELVVLPRRENVQLTIYNSADLTLVRERRNLTLKQGWNWLQFMWSETLIDPTSLTLEPLEHKSEVEVQQLVFPPRLRELGRWLIRSDVAGQVPFELTYLSSGLSWRAFYMGTLAQDERTMRLEGYVRVDNRSGEDYEDARTRLLVGKVHLLDEIRDLARRQHPYGSPVSFGQFLGETEGGRGLLRGLRFDAVEKSGAMGTWNAPMDAKEIVKEGLSEYFLYTIEGTETIPNEWGKRLLSFEADEIPVENLYKYDEERYGTDTVRFLSFANGTESKLGETPIPDGMVRVYGQVDAEAHLSYVGGTNVKYIPVGEEIELNLGPARLVGVEPVLMETATSNYAFDSNDNIIGWDETQTWRIGTTNASLLPVKIEVTRSFEMPYWMLELGQKRASYEKYDATHARFRVTLEPRERWSFVYTVTMYRGTRSAFYVRQQAEQEERGR